MSPKGGGEGRREWRGGRRGRRNENVLYVRRPDLNIAARVKEQHEPPSVAKILSMHGFTMFALRALLS
ncbi:hypothetical protein NECAME_14998 [Necator americanus]|uniref:Uncharacterized protein n=1 Tax=Necator americanus TaxID=51031 RepID=W2SK11_NECAM|nr:hypothetical protein NECAME_14998 [Necator americanus]ETN69945.1 hypothetical protein NECAME_14998 [Necator americanus]